MKPGELFLIMVVTVLAILALGQIDLLDTVIVDAGFTVGEFWSGVASVLLVFETVVFVLSWRG